MKAWITLSRSELADERPDGEIEDLHFSERLTEGLIAEFSVPDALVLDPFAGFGTVAAVAVRMGRRAIAVELLPDRAARIRKRLGESARVIEGDARDLARLVTEPVDLCLTSPPYMTRTRHAENPLTGYQTLDGSYPVYLEELEIVFAAVADLLRPGGHLVINVATTVNEDGATPLADDISERVSGHLHRQKDLLIKWDVMSPDLLDDRCLVFEKTTA